MQYPKCNHIVSEDTSYCTNCGYDVSIHKSFNTMKDDLGKINKEASSLSIKLDMLQRRFAQFEKLFTTPMAEKGETKSRVIPGEPVTPPQETKVKESPQKQEQRTVPPPFPASHKPQPSEIQASEIKLGQKWLLIAGVVLTVLAVGWFLKYSFEQNWIGPAVRAAMAYLTGIAFLGCGESFRRRDYQVFGL